MSSRTNPLSAAFWANADPTEPGSIQALEARRKIAEQLAKKSPFPTTLGQGLTYLGESLVERARMNELADAERASDVYNDKRVNEIRNTPGGYVPQAEGTAVAPARRDAYAQTDGDQTESAPLPPRRPVGGEETGLPMPAEPPQMPNALIAALRTAPQRNQPGAPSTWGSGRLQQVPTNLADVPPGTFGMRDPAAQGTVSVGRGDEMTVEPAAAPAGSLQPPGSPLSGVPYLTNEQRNRIAALISSQPRPFEQAPDAAPAPETRQAATAGQSGPLLADRETDADVTPPIRLASLGGMPAPNTAAVAANNPPIATDIVPMPRTAAADLPPSATGPTVPPSRIAQAPEPSPGIPPSRLPIPPDLPQEMKHPGPEPVQPRPLGPSLVQRQMEEAINDRKLNPTVREAAKRRYDAEEGYRKELEAARNNRYTNDRAQWNQDVRAYDKFVRETNDRDIDRRIKLQGIEKTNADLEEAYYKRGIPREQARKQADLEIANSLRRLTESDKVAVGGTHLERQRDEQGHPIGGYAVPQGLPPLEEKSKTELEGKADIFTKRALPEVQQLKSNGNGKALTYFQDDVLAARLPAGMDNKFISEQYQRDRNAMTNFGTALMTYLSGASYGEKEMQRTLSAYWPKYGDSDAEIDRKGVRREAIIAAISRMTDRSGREYVAKSNFDYEATQPAVRVASPEEAKKLSPGRHFITHDGRPMQVPFEEIRTR